MFICTGGISWLKSRNVARCPPIITEKDPTTGKKLIRTQRYGVTKFEGWVAYKLERASITETPARVFFLWERKSLQKPDNV